MQNGVKDRWRLASYAAFDRSHAMSFLSQSQRASFAASLGKTVRMKAKVEVSPFGLLAISVLVSAILLSTRALVGTALRNSHQNEP